MNPTIGRVVIYNTTALDQRMINEHPHNTPQEKSPAIIVAVAKETVNLKVFIDGHGDFYKNDVKQGDQPGEWDWPVIDHSNTILVADESLLKEEIVSALQQQGQTVLVTDNISLPVSDSLAKKLELFSENPPVQPTETDNRPSSQIVAAIKERMKAAQEEGVQDSNAPVDPLSITEPVQLILAEATDIAIDGIPLTGSQDIPAIKLAPVKKAAAKTEGK